MVEACLVLGRLQVGEGNSTFTQGDLAFVVTTATTSKTEEPNIILRVRGSGGDKIIFKKLSIVDKVEVSNSGTALTMEFRTSKGNSTLRIDATGQTDREQLDRLHKICRRSKSLGKSSDAFPRMELSRDSGVLISRLPDALRETYERQCRSSGSRSYFASAVQHEPATALQSQSTVVVQVPASQQPTATPSPALAADRPRTSALSTVPLRREETPQRQVQRPSVSLPRPALTSNPAKTGSKRSKAMVVAAVHNDRSQISNYVSAAKFERSPLRTKRRPDWVVEAAKQREGGSGGNAIFAKQRAQGSDSHLRSGAPSWSYFKTPSAIHIPPMKRVSGPGGFKNLGNTCYMSAVVSALVSLSPFVDDLRIFSKLFDRRGSQEKMAILDEPCEPSSSSDVEETRDRRLLCARMSCLQQFLDVCTQVDAKKEVIDLSGFKDALSETARQFASRAQQDAQEFFTAVLEALSSETLRAARTSGGPEHVSRKGPMSGDTQAAFSDADLCARSFGMCLRHTLTCQNTECAYRRSVTEPFRDLSLSVPEEDVAGVGPAALETLLQDYFADTELEYTCDKCGHKKARARQRSSALPRILVVHLKRFKPNFLKQRLEKLHTQVKLPLSIDLSAFTTSKTTPPPSCSIHVQLPRPSFLAGTSLPTPIPPDPWDLAAGACSAHFHQGHATVSAKRNQLSPSAPAECRGPELSSKSRDTVARRLGLGEQLPPRKLDFFGGECNTPELLAGSKRCVEEEATVSATFGSGRRLTQYAEEEADDLQRALEASMEDGLASVRAASPRSESTARASLSNYTSGDEQQDLRRALQLSAEAATEAAAETAAAEQQSCMLRPTQGVVSTGASSALSERTGSVQKEQRDEVSEDEEVLLGDTTVQDEEALFGDTTVEDEDDEDPGGAEIASSVDGHYALLAVVCHQGPSASHGHYVCDVWNAQKEHWERHDDSLVFSLGKLGQVARQDWQRGAYILVYVHVSCFRSATPPSVPTG